MAVISQLNPDVDYEDRSGKALQSFVTYCFDHPKERFWQALANWSKFDYIFGLEGNLDDAMIIIQSSIKGNIRDTYFIENLDGTRDTPL